MSGGRGPLRVRVCQHCGAELPPDVHHRRKYCPEGDCAEQGMRTVRARSFRRRAGRAAMRPPQIDRHLPFREARAAGLRASMAWREQDPRTAALLDRERKARGIPTPMEV